MIGTPLARPTFNNFLSFKAWCLIIMSSFALRRLTCVARRQLIRPQTFRPSVLSRLNSTATQPNGANASEAKPTTESPPLTLIENNNGGGPTDWSRSYHGLSVEPFAKEVADILQAPIDPLDVEIKPGAFHHLWSSFGL